MTKHTFKILQCSQHNIFKVCSAIFQRTYFLNLYLVKAQDKKMHLIKKSTIIFRIIFVSYYESLSFSVGVHTNNYSVISILVSDILVRKEGK